MQLRMGYQRYEMLYHCGAFELVVFGLVWFVGIHVFCHCCVCLDWLWLVVFGLCLGLEGRGAPGQLPVRICIHGGLFLCC